MTWLYKQLLRLYPAAFYEQFADEMTDTFQQRLRDQPGAGLHELLTLLAAIVQEHQRRNTIFYSAALLLPPALLGCIVLAFRPLHRFYLSYNLWLLFAGMSLFILVIGWLLERRMTVLALPGLGFLLFIALRIVSTSPAPGYDLPLTIQIAIPFLLLCIVLIRQRLHWSIWLPYLIALPGTALIISLIIMRVNSAFNLPLRELWNGYLLGAFIPMFLSLLILAGMPFARRFGSAAVLLIIGYLFFDLLGLSATLPDIPIQQFSAIGCVLLFLLVLPLLALKLPHYRTLIVLGGIALAYALIFLIKLALYELDTTFFLYRLNELAQTLIALALALRVYELAQRPAEVGAVEMARGAPLPDHTEA